MEEKQKEKNEISIENAVKMLDNLKEEIDFNKPDSELTPEEAVKKTIYTTLDKEVEKGLGKEKKKEIDEMRNKRDYLSKFGTSLKKLIEIGKEIEKNFLWQGAYLINHFNRSKENHFKLVVNGMSEDVIKKPMSDLERVGLSKKILEIIRVYREKVTNELTAKQEIISALVPAAEKVFNDTDFDSFNTENDKKSAEDMKSKFRDWITLSKELSINRKKAVEAVGYDLDMDEMVPQGIIKNGGDITKNFSGVEMKMKGDKMIKLITESDKVEKEITEKRDKLAEGLFGKPETYMDFPKEKGVTAPVQAVKKGGNKMKWIIVIALTVVALYWGIWTAIGVFVLGIIIISILSGNK